MILSGNFLQHTILSLVKGNAEMVRFSNTDSKTIEKKITPALDFAILLKLWGLWALRALRP